MRPNWFFGFPMDGGFLSTLPELPKSFRRFHVDDVHLTLAFLGGCREESAMRALEALDERMQHTRLAVMDISLGEVVAMGSRRRYSALSALLDRGRDEAIACIAAFRDALTEAATGRRDERPPKPHVTLARPKRRATDSDREAGLEWASSVDVRHVRTRLDRVALYTWSETRVDRMFKIVAERRLG
jgi:2'-5' RNA ligase